MGKYQMTSHRVTEMVMSQHVTKKSADGHEDCGRQDA